MSPMNPMNLGAFKKFAIFQLYAELYPFIITDFKHKDDVAAIIDAMVVQQHTLIKPLPGSYEAAGPARLSTLDNLAKTGQLTIQAAEKGLAAF